MLFFCNDKITTEKLNNIATHRLFNPPTTKMAYYIKREKSQLIVSGKTFELKETIKSIGGRWDPARRIWTIPMAVVTSATVLARLSAVARQDEEQPRGQKKNSVTTTSKKAEMAKAQMSEKAGISREAAEAVLAQMKPAEGHRGNTLLAQQTFVRFAKSKGITVTGAIVTMREWANGRE